METKLTLVIELINSLTEDEDLRQELWVHYLSDRSSPSLHDRLDVLRISQKVTCDNQYLLGAFVSRPLSDAASYAIEILEPVERHIVYLLALGLSPLEISKYKGIGEIRVKQAITSIQASPTWIRLCRSMSRCLRERSTRTKSSD